MVVTSTTINNGYKYFATLSGWMSSDVNQHPLYCGQPLGGS